MKVRSVSKSRLPKKRSDTLIPGQLVHGRVITKISPGFFRVGAAGQVFIAQSELPLEKGQRLTARVEVGDSKVFLRICEEEAKRATPLKRELKPEEVIRVLKGLGQHPDEMEVIEFMERLGRYRIHATLQDCEPSDIWVMAIMWTRGQKGGADVFVLLNYYLRHSGLSSVSFISADELKKFLSWPKVSKIAGEARRKVGERSHLKIIPQDPTHFLAERRSEARILLNKKKASFGSFHHLESYTNSAAALFMIDPHNRMGRWVDNPTNPGILIEAAEAQGRVKARLSWLKNEENAGKNLCGFWSGSWDAATQDSDLDVENFHVVETEDPEKLRFMFWRKWRAEQIRNISA